MIVKTSAFSAPQRWYLLQRRSEGKEKHHSKSPK